MKFNKQLFSACFLFAAAFAPTEAAEPVPEEFGSCTVCHGVQLKGNPGTGAPRLSGLQTWYVENQLESFRMGWRGNHSADYTAEEMRAVASGLSAKQLKKAPSYVNETVSSLSFTHTDGDVDKGKALFASCSACHGATGGGNEALAAPSLLVQSDWYLEKQINDFRNGLRGAEKDDASGQLMAASVATLKTDDDINNLMAYIVHLQQQEMK
ncbi:c-type cytochrome [Aestuariicella hydrocarbonica]|uniref:C-type cytochrome n=1 Tax=Pseudomaricurvus hydrocarbonicus TaxID=1470433 RepID=A0A9E5JU78_9GAMM|nr:c-type cytochrome [Aestuariicella hydrocarbonica]NHO64975.1 c-type cytochrome [Aestuariicella hydrocarbonica]